jgi:hypothetical protein
MNNHPYGISQLTSAHSHDLLDEGRRRQLAKTAAPRPSSLLRQPARTAHSWAWRALALAGSLLAATVPGRSHRSDGTQTPDWPGPLATSKSVATHKTL